MYFKSKLAFICLPPNYLRSNLLPGKDVHSNSLLEMTKVALIDLRNCGLDSTMSTILPIHGTLKDKTLYFTFFSYFYLLIFLSFIKDMCASNAQQINC